MHRESSLRSKAQTAEMDGETKIYGLTSQDWRQIREWNISCPAAVESSIHDLVRQRAETQPDAVAICAWDGQLTYRELDRCTTHLAFWLITQGVGPDVRVPFCFEKSKWAVIAMFAIMKAGSAFVPIDFTQPMDRLKVMIRETGSLFIATSTSTAQTFESCSEVRTIVFNQELLDGLSLSQPDKLTLVNPNQIAFIMFTSGSTGKPSGVMIEHSAMATAAMNYALEFGFNAESRVMQFTSFVWLPCTVEILSTLIWGGRVCIPSEEDRLNNASRFMEEHKVNLAVLTPSFLGSMSPKDVPSLKVLGLGGEKVPQHIIDEWAGSVMLIMAYGSTETNLCMLQTITGGPHSNTEGHAVGAVTWIVDQSDSGKLAPIGTIGELVIESWALARGYLNDQEKTSEKFLRPPEWLRDFRSNNASRLYKVGDLARYRMDGTVQVVGRRDAMVKIRGQRVELGDVEIQIRQLLPHFWRVAVEAVKLADGDATLKLIAFISMGAETLDTPDEMISILHKGKRRNQFSLLLPKLKTQLSQKLPHYMVPSTFVPLNGFPLTAGGKLDRQRLRFIASNLPIEDLAGITGGSITKRPPSTTIEHILCELWLVLLKAPYNNIGLDDDFFRLGGDSVTAIRLVSEARRRKIKLTVDAIFENPTLYNMALACKLTDKEDVAEMGPFELVERKTIIQLCDEISTQYNINKNSIVDIYPCTHLQTGLIAHTMKRHDAYIVRSIIHLSESVNILRFKNAWELVVQQNSILRTRLVQTSIGSMQVVLGEQIEWFEGDIVESLEHYLTRDKQATIHAGNRLSRYAIIDDPLDGRHFIWSAHHALFDAWSMIIIFRQVESAYLGIQVEQLPGYNKFIKHLLALDHEAQKSYWRNQLEGASVMPFPALPAQNYQPVGDKSIKEKVCFTRSPESQVTSATIVQAAWALLLSHYSNTDDVIFGATLSGRTQPVPQIEEMLGPTITTVPIRIHAKKTQTIPSFLQEVQHQATKMIPFEHIGLQNIKNLSPEIHHACDFQTLLVIQTSTQTDSLRFLDQPVRNEGWENSSSHALTLECTFIDEGILCQAVFDSHIIHETQVGFILSQFEHIIKQLCLEDSTVTVQDIEAFSEHDSRQIWEWNKSMPKTTERCVHDLFQERVVLQPNSVAVDAWDGAFTYRELNEIGSQLAHYVAGTENIGPEDIVPVCFQKSKWMIVSMLAIWKAGGAWAPVDAAHPKAWIESISQNIDPKLVLCSASAFNLFPSMTRRLIVDDKLLKSLAPNTKHIDSLVTPKNIAYVIHTSGSTGLPKGIVHEHRSYVSGVIARIPTMFRNSNARALQFASYSFDVSIEDIWTTLLVGGVVCVPSDHERSNDIVGYMNRANVNYAELTPSFVKTLRPDSLPNLKILALSGEASTRADRDPWVDKVILLDEYGPAEIAIKSHLKHIQQDTVPSDKGHSVACLSWIVDVSNHDKLQGVGAIGELLLEGPILSRGYLNKEEKTKEVYIDNPSWLSLDKYGPRRLYKSGDLARYGRDGTVQVLGRKDTQVKLRGHRIELSQIEYQVRSHLSTANEIVVDLVFLKNGNKNGTLVVFVSLGSESSSSGSSQFLSYVDNLYVKLLEALPMYMVPSALISLPSLPLNMSGKVDRLKLKQMARELNDEEIIFFSSNRKPPSRAKPFTNMEKRLQSLWAEALDIAVDGIRVDDSFVQLGGDSILAMKMVAAAGRRKDAITLTVENIFRQPRLSDMALVASDASKNPIRKQMDPYEMFGTKDSPEIDALREEVAMLCEVDLDIVEDAYFCSPLQEGIMALSIKNPGFYVSQLVFDLPKTVDLPRLHDAWELVSRKTATLRTRIIQRDSGMLQAVLKSSIQWIVSKNMAEYLKIDKGIPMQLGGPLVRYAIVSNSDHYSFVWTLHHAIYDGWSSSLILDAVTKAYSGNVNWSPMAEFKEFIKYITSIDRDTYRNYWRNQLADVAEMSSFYPRLPSPTYQPHAQSSVSREIRVPPNALKNTTASTLLQAAWALLVSQHSGSKDIIFGTTLTGRNAPLIGIDEIVGPVFTTVPIRVKLETDITIPYFLYQLQNQVVEMIAFEHLGLHDISQINDDAKKACEFGTLIVVQPPQQNISQDDVFTKHQLSEDFSKFNPYSIMIQFTQVRKNVMLTNANFDSNVVDEMQMQRLLQHLEHILSQLGSRDTERKLSSIEVLTTHDMREISMWNNNALPAEPNFISVHEKVKRRALEQPESPAVCSWDGDLSYRMLNDLSDRLSYHLIGLGVGRDIIVPLCFEKSMWTVVAMLGILKAGGAFVLLDPSHPLKRLKEILKSTKANILLSSPTHAGLFRSDVGITIIISRSFVSTWTRPYGDKVVTVSPGDLACVVFTSGSTGTPKGIMLEHSAICASILAHAPALNLDAQSRVLQFASYAFDMAIYDICSTLVQGGCVCTPSDHDKINNLTGSIDTMMVNWAFFTPSTLNLFCREDVPKLSTLVVGGEAVTQKIVDEWAEEVRLFQCSGPAETTMCIAGEMSRKTNKNRLGRGVGAKCWIVDQEDHSVLLPIGAVGELVIEGPTIARGYVGENDTASALFIQDPIWARDIQDHGDIELLQRDPPCRRMYKTGDLVQYNSDGSMNFMGRKDTQVKLRGQRIELNEVEECLRAWLPDVQIAVEVLTALDGNRELTLAAFISLGENESPVADAEYVTVCDKMPEHFISRLADMEKCLSDSLPHYMIPSVTIPLSGIPINSSGKTHRGKLRQLGSCLSIQQMASFSATARQKRLPTTEMEFRMQRMWAEVLNIDIDSIGAEDSFLRLGGDSITTMRLVAIAHREKIALTVADVFKIPYLSDMARHSTLLAYEDQRYAIKPFALLGSSSVAHFVCEEVVSELKVERDDIMDIYPCTPLQEGLMALSIENPGAYVAQEVYSLCPKVDLQRFKTACEVVFDAHAILRTRIMQLKSSKMVQVVLQDKIRWFDGNNMAEYLEQDRQTPIQLGDALTRWAIIGSQRPSFVWTKHHSSYDGHSISLTLKMIEQAYEVQSGSGLVQVPRVGFNDFINYITNRSPVENLDYWRRYLDGSKPTNFPRITALTKSPRPDSSVEIQIDLNRAPDSGITIPTMIRAAWAFLLARYVGTNDVVLGTTLSGRNAPLPEVDKIMGPTFTTVPVRVSFDDECMTIMQCLKDVQDQAIKMIPFEHLGLQKIKQISSEIRAACGFQSILIIQPMPDRTEESILSPQYVKGHSTFYTYAFTLECQLSSRGIVAAAKFDASIIDETQVRRLLNQFENVLQQFILQHPSGRLKDISIITPSDLNEIWNWNAIVPETINSCVHMLIEQQMLAQPKSMAVQSWDGTLSYEYLDNYSSKLADHLITLGVGHNSIIPILFEKSMWTIVAIIGILRAGGAFVPLDASHPPARLQALIQQVNATLVLTCSNNRPLCIQIAQRAFVVNQSSIDDLLDRKAWKQVDQDSSNPVYINFTSGSTGVPKAAIIEHAAYCSGANGHIKQTAINGSSRVLQFASYSFDDCIKDILTTLIVGACICIPSEYQRINDIVGAMKSLRVNWAHLTPSFAKLIDPQSVPGLKVLLLGGEVMTEQLVQIWSHQLHLINAYGPSELCVTCCVNPEVGRSQEAANIGKAVGCVAWVTEPADHSKLAPIGFVGELLIEGPLMARGYLNDPEKTSTAFIKSPAWLKRGHGVINGRSNTLYKTGDLVRYDSQGSLVYVGRKDTQVKLRGQRIELSEIEHHLKAGMTDMTVDVAVEMFTRRGGTNSQTLAAFICLTQSATNGDTLPKVNEMEFKILAERLQQQLSMSLPAYMIPSFFIPLAWMPLTMSKKIDRKALRQIASEMSAEELSKHVFGGGEKCEPKTHLEQQIQSIWCEVLNLSPPQVGLNTSFMAMGGDSISAMQVLARCRKASIKTSLQDIMRYTTISRICEKIALPTISADQGVDYIFNNPKPNSRLLDSDESCFRTVNGVKPGRDDEDEIEVPFELSPIQRRFFSLYPEGNNSEQLSHILRLKAPVGFDRFSAALSSIVTVHSMLRARFNRSKEGQWEQRITNDVSGSFRFQLYENIDSESIESLAIASCSLIDIQTGPLLVANMFTTAHDQAVFLTAHHLATDLVSWRIILQDLEELLQTSDLMAPAQKSLSYPSWCSLQFKYARENLNPNTILPFTIRPTPFAYWGSDVLQENYITHYSSLDQKKSMAILHHCDAVFQTKPLDLFLSAAIYSFSQIFPDRECPTIFNVSHGRQAWDDSIDLSRSVGWFTVMYPLQVDVKPNHDITNTIRNLSKVHRQIASNGTAYFASHYLHPKGEEVFGSHSSMEIVLNYTGIYQQLERKDALFQDLQIGHQDLSHRESKTKHSAIFEIIMRVKDDQLGYTFSFSPLLKHQDRIQLWIKQFQRSLEEMAIRLNENSINNDTGRGYIL